jgi:uncharacterized cupin superfamily protein
MGRINISNPVFTYDPDDPEGSRSGMYRFGPEVGAKESGASVYELPPGQAVCPYHYEYAEEEWALVLDGRPTLRTPEGRAQLEPYDVAFFPRVLPALTRSATTPIQPSASSCGRP